MRSTLSYILVVLHVLIYVWYYSNPIGWKTYNLHLAKAVFYGIPFVIIGINIILSTFKCAKYQLEILRMHGTLMIVFGLSYSLHYLGFITIGRSSLISLCIAVLLLFIFVLFNVRIHRLHSK